jgi:Fe-S cluster biogenesis protein NfuA/nitrite reductase/ring-hydroxylating ferredoxin subunit
VSEELEQAATRIESLLAASAAGGPGAQARAEDLVACVTNLYGDGLRRLLEVLDGAGALSPVALDALADDELVAGLLLVHDLHPYDARTRVVRGLDSVRPYLGSHGGDVELAGIDEDADGLVVRLRLLGSCDGCPSSSVTLELAVECAVQTAAPEVSRIEVSSPAAATPLISLDSLRARLDRPDSGTWVAVPDLAALEPGEVAGFALDGVQVCACRVGADAYCFRDECGGCGRGLAGAVVERRLGDPAGTLVLRCAHCRAHFDIRHAGVGLDGTDAHLTPLPILTRDGVLSVAVPAAIS